MALILWGRVSAVDFAWTSSGRHASIVAVRRGECNHLRCAGTEMDRPGGHGDASVTMAPARKPEADSRGGGRESRVAGRKGGFARAACRGYLGSITRQETQ